MPPTRIVLGKGDFDLYEHLRPALHTLRFYMDEDAVSGPQGAALASLALETQKVYMEQFRLLEKALGNESLFPDDIREFQRWHCFLWSRLEPEQQKQVGDLEWLRMELSIGPRLHREHQFPEPRQNTMPFDAAAQAKVRRLWENQSPVPSLPDGLIAITEEDQRAFDDELEEREERERRKWAGPRRPAYWESSPSQSRSRSPPQITRPRATAVPRNTERHDTKDSAYTEEKDAAKKKVSSGTKTVTEKKRVPHQKSTIEKKRAITQEAAENSREKKTKDQLERIIKREHTPEATVASSSRKKRVVRVITERELRERTPTSDPTEEHTKFKGKKRARTPEDNDEGNKTDGSEAPKKGRKRARISKGEKRARTPEYNEEDYRPGEGSNTDDSETPKKGKKRGRISKDTEGLTKSKVKNQPRIRLVKEQQRQWDKTPEPLRAKARPILITTGQLANLRVGVPKGVETPCYQCIIHGTEHKCEKTRLEACTPCKKRRRGVCGLVAPPEARADYRARAWEVGQSSLQSLQDLLGSAEMHTDRGMVNASLANSSFASARRDIARFCDLVLQLYREDHDRALVSNIMTDHECLKFVRDHASNFPANIKEEDDIAPIDSIIRAIEPRFFDHHKALKPVQSQSTVLGRASSLKKKTTADSDSDPIENISDDEDGSGEDA